MSNYQYSSNAVDSLIAYINDVKPFHSKLTEIVEEYQFYENLDVVVDDKQHFIKTKIAGVWDNEVYSNGLYSPFINLPFIKQSKSSKYWSNSIRLTESDRDSQLPGLQTAYYLRHNIGVRKVVNDGRVQNEGVDFHISHGAFSVNIDGSKKRFVETSLSDLTMNADDGEITDEFKRKVKGLQIISESTELIYNEVEDANAVIANIVPNLDTPVYDEWTLECIQSGEQNGNSNLSYEHVQKTQSTNWVVKHKLGSTDLFLQCFVVSNGTLVPIMPNSIQYFDENTIHINFTSPRSGKVKIIKFVNSAQTFGQHIDQPSDVWEITHNLNTKDLIAVPKIYINGVLEQVVPKQIIFLDENRIQVIFSTPQTGKISIGALRSYASKVFNQPNPSTTWSFDNTLRADSGIFIVVRDDGNIIFPQEITFSKSLIFVKFSTPTAGKLLFAKLFSSGQENTLFSVTGAISGMIGYARAGYQFSSDLISFIVKPKSETTVFSIGEKYVLTPANKITTHKSYVSNEKWSIIKVNPIAHLKPKFSKSGAPTIENFVFLDKGVREQTISLIFNGSTFVVKSDDGSFLGNVNVGSTFTNDHFSFNIKSGNISPVIGDNFEIKILNPEPKVEGLDFTVGYDMIPYDDAEYDDHLINFDLTSLNIKIENPAIPSCRFELVFDGTEFTVSKYQDLVSKQLLATYESVKVGIPYNNNEFSISIPDTVSYVQGDMIVFNVVNSDPSINKTDLFMHSKRFGWINLYPKSFIDSPAQQWKIQVNDDSSLTVIGSKTGRSNIQGSTINSYDNGMIHFTLIEGEIPFQTGDSFYVDINDEKPSYLVYGETSGFMSPITVGKWYWNGKFGLKIEEPRYRIKEFTSSGRNNYPTRELKTGDVIIDSVGRKITFNKPPRYDAKSDVYKLALVKNLYKGQQYFSVKSSISGVKRGLTMNERYIDDMRVEQSKGLGFDYHDGVVDITVKGPNFDYNENNPCILTFEVESNSPSLYHGNDLIIFNEDVSSKVVDVERETNDVIFIKTNVQSPLLGTDANNEWIPSYAVQKNAFSDESRDIEIFSSILNKKVGYVRTLGDETNYLYQFVVDTEFFNEFLPFNTTFGTKVVQNEQENSIVKARISEKMKVFDFNRFTDNVKLNITDRLEIKIDLSKFDKTPFFLDKINVTVDDKTFRGFFSGYDTLPFDIEPHGYEDTDEIQNEFFSTSAGGIGYLIKDKSPAVKASSKISDTFVAYSGIANLNLDYVDPVAVDNQPAYDSFGWENASVDTGLSPVDAEGWDNASFDMTYSQLGPDATGVIYELTVNIGKLEKAAEGSPLFGTNYADVPAEMVNVIRKVNYITVMRKGNAFFNTLVMFTDETLQQQVPTTVVESTNDYVKIKLTNPSTGKLVIF